MASESMRVAFLSLALAFLVAALGAAPLTGQEEYYERGATHAPQEQDIGDGYVTPPVQHPLPRARWHEVLDASLFALAIAAAAWLAVFRRSRWGLVALTLACLAYFGFYREGCVCPVGSTQNVAVALTDPDYAVPYHVVAIFLAPLVAALFFGRVFCAGVCPLGAIQEVVLLRPVRVPARLDRVLRWIPWIYLVAAVGLAVRPALARDFIICRYDPFVGLFRWTGTATMLGLGGGLLLLGTVVGRPYCRWICPYGALLSVFSRFAWRPVTITPHRELDCGLCAGSCPYGAIEQLRAVRSQCVACARCYRSCPVHRQEQPGREAEAA